MHGADKLDTLLKSLQDLLKNDAAILASANIAVGILLNVGGKDVIQVFAGEGRHTDELVRRSGLDIARDSDNFTEFEV